MSKKRIYFDHAATTPLLPEVKDHLCEVAGKYYGNPSSTHAEGRASRSFIEESRKTVSRYLSCNPSELFFTSSGSESNNLILKSCVRSLGVTDIISTPIEHACNLRSYDWLSERGLARIHYLEVDRFGRFDEEQLDTLLRRYPGPTTLVSLMHVNNELGTITDIESTGLLAHSHGALFHSDTVQGIGFSRYALRDLPLDFATGSAHKFYAPKGSAFVYIRSGNLLDPIVHGGSQERNMRAGTENIYGIGALSFALSRCYDELDSRLASLAQIRERFISNLMEQVPGLELNSPPENTSPKIVNVHFPWFEGIDLMNVLFDVEGLSVSAGSACSSGAEKGSHVISTIRPNHPGKAVRFSFAHFNTTQEVDQAIEIISKCLKGKW
ncbi:MAG: cysteine desulfurase [Saprospiraceae bacterium]|nr:cysteine desulfurase [Saprospiraceae bacterium]